MMQPNARLIKRPSQAMRWVHCPAAPRMEAQFPEDDGPEAREGTAAHFYPTELLQGREWAIGTVTPNGVPITEEMVNCADELVSDVRRELAMATALGEFLFRVECKVYAHTLIHPDVEGTPDIFLLIPSLKLLIIWDYKFGHLFVDPFKFWQAICYFAGIVEGSQFTREEFADWSVSIRVAQPRNYSREGTVRRWDTTGAKVFEYVENLRWAAIASDDPNAPTKAGDHCRDCTARHGCAANLRMNAAMMHFAGQGTPIELSDLAMGLELMHIKTALKRLEARQTALEQVALHKIAAGGSVPYWSKGFVNSKETWRDGASAIAMAAALGKDISRPEPITPNQARKALAEVVGEDAAAALVAPYAFRPTGASKLILSDETAALKAFS